MAVDLNKIKDIYPFKNNYFQVSDKVKLHYVDEGEGNPVVFVHGNPTWSFYFRDLISELSKDHRCIAIDHVGCGLSDKPVDEDYDFRYKSRVDNLEALLESLDIKGNVTLVVHDWGGAIGFGYAARHPERIKRLVVLNTGAFDLPETKKFPLALNIIRNTPLGSLLVYVFNAFARAAVSVCPKLGLDEKARYGYLAPYDNWNNRRATLRFVQDIPLSEKDHSWNEIQKTKAGLENFKDTPAIICWGEQDFVFDNHFLNKWKEYLPQAKVNVWADSGHYILEDKKDEVRKLVREFVDSTPIDDSTSTDS